MKKSVLMSVVILLMAIPSAQAAVTLSSVSGSWSNVIQEGGSTDTIYETVASGYGNLSEDRFLSGDWQGRSGLGFTGAVAQTFALGTAFEIGQLKHYNQPTYAGAPTAADLTIDLSFSDPAGLNGTFLFNFQINNTPNIYGDSRDDDIVTFPGSYPTEVFTIGGQDYTLQLLGFGNSATSLISQFSSPERGDNATLLWGRITTPQPNVPAPAAILLAGLGTGLVGWLRRRRTL